MTMLYHFALLMLNARRMEKVVVWIYVTKFGTTTTPVYVHTYV